LGSSGSVRGTASNGRSYRENQIWHVEIKGLFRCVNEVHIRSMKYGYARVSTDGQSVEAQVRQLTKAGCRKVLRETRAAPKPTEVN
jgi:Resolvase, N terminal domain